MDCVGQAKCKARMSFHVSHNHSYYFFEFGFTVSVIPKNMRVQNALTKRNLVFSGEHVIKIDFRDSSPNDVKNIAGDLRSRVGQFVKSVIQVLLDNLVLYRDHYLYISGIYFGNNMLGTLSTISFSLAYHLQWQEFYLDDMSSTEMPVMHKWDVGMSVRPHLLDSNIREESGPQEERQVLPERRHYLHKIGSEISHTFVEH